MDILNFKDFRVENPFNLNNEIDMINKSSINNVKKEKLLNNSLFHYFPVTKEIKINNEKFKANIFIKESKREIISDQFNNFDIIDDLKMENLDNCMDHKESICSDSDNSYDYSSRSDSISFNSSIIDKTNENNNNDENDEEDNYTKEVLNNHWKELNKNFINESSNENYWKNY